VHPLAPQHGRERLRIPGLDGVVTQPVQLVTTLAALPTDIEISGGYPVDETIRRVGQLG
jgi:hypothetical protein